MAKRAATTTPNSTKKIRPAKNPEARERQMISLAYDLVQQRLIDGTASSQETTHFLKLATQEARLKNKLLEVQADLAVAKREDLEGRKEYTALVEEAIKAIQDYNGRGAPDEYDY